MTELAVAQASGIVPATVPDPVFGELLTETPPGVPPRRNFWNQLATYNAPAGSSHSSEEMLELGGLNWDVEVRQGSRPDKDGNPVKSMSYSVIKMPGDFELGTVRKRFVPIPNREIFAFGDKLAETGHGQWVATGEQRHGARVFMVMRLAEGFTVLGEDAHELYLVFRAGHDGGMAVRGDVTPIRMGCFNQNQIVDRTSKARFSIHHTGDVTEKIKQAQSALELAGSYREHYQEVAERLAAVEVDITKAEKLIKEVMDDRAEKDKIADLVISNWKTSTTIPDSIRNTGWGFLNGVTEAFDHRVPRYGNGNSLFDSTMDGESARTRNRLVRRLLKV